MGISGGVQGWMGRGVWVGYRGSRDGSGSGGVG